MPDEQPQCEFDSWLNGRCTKDAHVRVRLGESEERDLCGGHAQDVSESLSTGFITIIKEYS